MDRIAALLLTLMLASPVLAALQAVEQAFELRPDQVTLPGSAGGQLIVRRCAGCAPVLLQVTAKTACFVSPDRAAVSLQELLDALADSTPRQKTLLNVFYEPETRRVTRIVLEPAR